MPSRTPRRRWRNTSEHFRALQALVAEEQALSTAESAREQELDLLRHQVHEITAAQLQPDEEEEIAGALPAGQQQPAADRARHRRSRASSPRATTRSSNRLAETQRLLRELEQIDPGLTESAEAHAAAVIELSEIARTLERYAERLDLDPEQLAQLEQRVTLLETLKRKYGGSLAEVIAFGEQAAERMRKIEGRDAELERLADAIAQARAKLEKAGAALRKLRDRGRAEAGENRAARICGSRLPAGGIRGSAHA